MQNAIILLKVAGLILALINLTITNRKAKVRRVIKTALHWWAIIRIITRLLEMI